MAARKMGWAWVHEGRAQDPSRTAPGRTLGQLLDAWWEDKRPTLRDSTADRSTESKYRRLRDLFGSLSLTDEAAITPANIRQALGRARFSRSKKGKLVPLSSASIRKHWDHMGDALRWGVAEHWLRSNPLAEVKPPKVRSPKAKAWTQPDMDAFLAATKGERMHILWLAALTLGARKSELLGLQWSDFDGAQVHIREQLVHIRRDDETWEWARAPLKTDKEDGHAKGVRWVEVPPVLAAALEEHKAAAKPECPWVFATSAGSPFEPRNVTTYFERAQAKAGVPKITFHGMRHTHASLMLEAGADPLAVADRLGHSLQVLLNTYRHILDKRKDRAAGVARSLFGGAHDP